MSTPLNHRPRSAVHSFSTSNTQDDDGKWVTEVFSKWMWITMQPSTRGAHKVPRRHLGLRSHHWKGRILELKQFADGKKMVKVQHVYKASQLKVSEEERRRYPTNYIFPSNFVEWESIEVLTGTFEALHVEYGKLLYAGVSASELLDQEIFFYGGHMWCRPQETHGGRLSQFQHQHFLAPNGKSLTRYRLPSHVGGWNLIFKMP